jgi:hypothetical protein
MSDEAKSSRGQTALVLVIGLAVLALYVLSVGPVGAVVEHSGFGEDAARVFYAPLIWLHHNTVLKEPLEAYARLWGWGPAR